VKPKDTLVINLNVGWRTLAILGIALGALVLAYPSAGVQADDPPVTNSGDVEPAAPPPEPAPPPLPDASAAPGPGLVLTTNGEWVPADSSGSTSSSAAGPTEVTVQSVGGRHFYLTAANYSPSAALTACGSGYHMASLWEILDVSALTYDYQHPAAYTKADSGQGPPSFWYGWVRTGQDSSGSSVAGSGNCLNWSSSSGTNSGVSVRLSNNWETSPGDIFTWDATSFTCNFTGPIWCVGN
jgi:hypothetical protein